MKNQKVFIGFLILALSSIAKAQDRCEQLFLDGYEFKNRIPSVQEVIDTLGFRPSGQAGEPKELAFKIDQVPMVLQWQNKKAKTIGPSGANTSLVGIEVVTSQKSPKSFHKRATEVYQNEETSLVKKSHEYVAGAYQSSTRAILQNFKIIESVVTHNGRVREKLEAAVYRKLDPSKLPILKTWLVNEYSITSYNELGQKQQKNIPLLGELKEARGLNQGLAQLVRRTDVKANSREEVVVGEAEVLNGVFHGRFVLYHPDYLEDKVPLIYGQYEEGKRVGMWRELVEVAGRSGSFFNELFYDQNGLLKKKSLFPLHGTHLFHYQYDANGLKIWQQEIANRRITEQIFDPLTGFVLAEYRYGERGELLERVYYPQGSKEILRFY